MQPSENSIHHTRAALQEIPTVDWLDQAKNRNKFLQDLRYALTEYGFLVPLMHPVLMTSFSSEPSVKSEAFSTRQ